MTKRRNIAFFLYLVIAGSAQAAEISAQEFERFIWRTYNTTAGANNWHGDNSNTVNFRAKAVRSPVGFYAIDLHPPKGGKFQKGFFINCRNKVTLNDGSQAYGGMTVRQNKIYTISTQAKYEFIDEGDVDGRTGLPEFGIVLEKCTVAE